eukprot:6766973-Prymnesium_polylepis.2
MSVVVFTGRMWHTSVTANGFTRASSIHERGSFCRGPFAFAQEEDQPFEEQHRQDPIQLAPLTSMRVAPTVRLLYLLRLREGRSWSTARTKSFSGAISVSRICCSACPSALSMPSRMRRKQLEKMSRAARVLLLSLIHI